MSQVEQVNEIMRRYHDTCALIRQQILGHMYVSRPTNAGAMVFDTTTTLNILNLLIQAQAQLIEMQVILGLEEAAKQGRSLVELLRDRVRETKQKREDWYALNR